MIEQIAFYGFILGIVWFFRSTSSNQRQHALNITLWLLIVFGVVGFMAEVVMRGGRLPIS